MTKLYILEKIKETELLALTQDNSSEFVSFDFCVCIRCVGVFVQSLRWALCFKL